MEFTFHCPECHENFTRTLIDEDIEFNFSTGTLLGEPSNFETCADCKVELTDTYFVTKKKAKQFLAEDENMHGERWLKDNGFWNNPEGIIEDARRHAREIVGDE
ncbi:MAG: hypothetical protein NUV56_01065 [Candidatus Uhrbacteria bacterium]|nr:hypothetical protein [Candidatus Uhrbacteria bacterium]